VIKHSWVCVPVCLNLRREREAEKEQERLKRLEAEQAVKNFAKEQPLHVRLEKQFEEKFVRKEQEEAKKMLEVSCAACSDSN